MINVLNLYAGIGGNRKLWKNVKVTAIENNPQIAQIYQKHFPDDVVMVVDAHQYLLEHFQEFDFIWSSPPCPSHSYFRKKMGGKQQRFKTMYPDMRLYEEIIFLKYYFKGKYVIENVKSYYTPLIKPQLIGRHWFWTNFHISKIKIEHDNIEKGKIKELEIQRGFDLSNERNIDKKTILKNCVNSKLGLHILNCAFKIKQQKMDDYDEMSKI